MHSTQGHPDDPGTAERCTHLLNQKASPDAVDENSLNASNLTVAGTAACSHSYGTEY